MATSVNRSLLFDVNLLTSNLHPPLSTSRYVEKHLLPNRNGGNRNAIIAESYVYTATSTREHVHMLPNIVAAFNFHAPIASVVNVDDTPSHSNFPDNGNIELTRDGESNIRKLHDVDDSSSTHPSRQVLLSCTRTLTSVFHTTIMHICIQELKTISHRPNIKTKEAIRVMY
ncbi:hypothetical protein DPMN_133944 [Dreissena polymorpha]|uniref:Uncharacterized protein n=1 Tax=Dreissena polymorpha TaxID=45954 RepID=A0A9D4JDD4_DREPO|nr:hypothetical protein DPMN_133944 [Dreissena polymorpha]